MTHGSISPNRWNDGLSAVVPISPAFHLLGIVAVIPTTAGVPIASLVPGLWIIVVVRVVQVVRISSPIWIVG